LSESAEKTAGQVRFEVEQIDQLFTVYSDLFEHVQQRTPDMVEVAAIASVLHSFYNGLENIFMSIAKGLDQQVPSGPQWHRDLLVQMSQQTSHRRGVISAELAERIADYLAFRHFYRHSYSFFLEWGELKGLVTPLRQVWDQVKGELSEFLKSLKSS
jgi:hypothetical protein